MYLDQGVPYEAVWSGFTLFASTVTLVNEVSKCMQQMAKG